MKNQGRVTYVFYDGTHWRAEGEWRDANYACIQSRRPEFQRTLETPPNPPEYPGEVDVWDIAAQKWVSEIEGDV